MTAHKQVYTKVNAPVDRGISPLVSALSLFPKLQTIESCEDLNGWAWVAFTYGDHWERPWEDLARFVLGFLGPAVMSTLGDRAKISVHVTEAGLYHAEMAIEKPAISATVKLLRKLSSNFSD
jgi:hypothetical protein